MMKRAGMVIPDDLTRAAITVGTRDRTYALSPPPTTPRAVLLVLHGAGGTGAGMAALTGLSTRGSDAGFVVAFPDGVGGVWNDQRDAAKLQRRADVDDVAFLAALAERLAVRDDNGDAPLPVFACGISNGALMSEHLARHALVPLAGIGLVAGAATVVSRTRTPAPTTPTLVVMFEGTNDPLVPYGGGPIGPLGQLVQRRARRGHGEAGRGLAAPAEAVAADWARTNGLPGEAAITQLPRTDAGLVVDRLAWTAPGRPSVVLHRIVGGGHTWPGGAQYLPERFVGAVARGLDASGIVLELFATVIDA
jgi:polyhydroxybutyrate depolymerase